MYTATSTDSTRAPRRVSVRILIVSLLASAGLAVSVNPALAAFAGGLHPAADTAQTLAMRQTLGSSVADAQAGRGAGTAVATGNAYGGEALPAGGSNTQVLTFTNTGTAPVRSLVAHGTPCSQIASGPVAGDATDLCDRVAVRIASGGSTVFSGTATAFGRAGGVDVLEPSGRGPVPPGHTVEVAITVTLSPALGNSYQGLQISQPITWRFGA